jgi:fatty acid desaturase
MNGVIEQPASAAQLRAALPAPVAETRRGLRGRFLACDGPTLLLAACLYGAWGLLIWYHALLPWWLIMPIGAYLIAWHFSLQHEAIHSFRGVPAWLRFAIVFPPLGLWFPYALYRRSHSIHHRDRNLTEPGQDTESYYVRRADWERMGRLQRALLLFNQTLLGRLLIGPLLRLWKLLTRELGRLGARDFSHVRTWLVHVLAVGVLFWFICDVCGMAWWQYVFWIAYPGFSLGLLRAFTEHRAAPGPEERTAAVESNTLFGLLFLYNNLHIVHHLEPTLEWYRIPAYFRAHRDTLLALNDHFYFRGYGQIARRNLLRPVFHPIHPYL